MALPSGQLEWLETNSLGSFCLCSLDRKLRRKYHALLTVRDPGHGDSWNLLAELLEHVELGDQRSLLANPFPTASAQVTGSASASEAELLSFEPYPHATHVYRAQGLRIERQVRLGEHDQVEVRYLVRDVKRALAAQASQGPMRITISPLLRCRPIHELTQANPFLDGTCHRLGDELRMLPYAGMPELSLRLLGSPSSRFTERGAWYAMAGYEWESARGYPASESLFSPGEWTVELSDDAELTVLVGLHRTVPPGTGSPRADAPQAGVSASSRLPDKLARAARQFRMRSQSGVSALVAGYPWFGAWSRDTLIALPGVYLATGDFDGAAAVLDGLVRARVGGLIPNIPALGGTPVNTSSVDASLLFARTVQWFAAQVGEAQVARFMPVICELLESLADGSDPRMRLDAGIGVYTLPGRYALTWMDALVDGIPVTPRAGYAVDIDALAYNAAHFACRWADHHKPQFARAFRTRLRSAEADFAARYWDDGRGYLADSHDGRHADTSLRPNQLWALGLPYRPVSAPIARASLTAVTRELLVPAGLRTLAPYDYNYRGSYQGAQVDRDLAYHQGTVWPWLIGIYADAVLAQLGRNALEGQLTPVLAHLAHHLDAEGCVGQVSEVFSGDAPHVPGGAPAQAWSVAELLRALHLMHGISP